VKAFKLGLAKEQRFAWVDFKSFSLRKFGRYWYRFTLDRIALKSSKLQSLDDTDGLLRPPLSGYSGGGRRPLPLPYISIAWLHKISDIDH
jgi:hypothetical protein